MKIKQGITEHWLFLFSFGYAVVGLVLLWFLTKSWLPREFVIAGHDSGLALDARQFLIDRFYAWDDHLNFGEDNSANFGSITIHLLDYILAAISGVEFAGNQLVLFFWLATIFTVAFVFSLAISRYTPLWFRFMFPVFITFNFYVFQSIFMLERAKYGLLAATLLFTGLAFQVLDRKLSIVSSAIIATLVFFIFNGGSMWGLPLYGGLIILAISLIITTLADSLKTRTIESVVRLVVFFALTLIGYLLINSYAIIPYVVKFLSGDYSVLFNPDVIAPNRAWLDYISQSSSFLNIFRLQGIPDWYDTATVVNQNHPYASRYIADRFLVVASFLFPILALLSFFFVKSQSQKRIIVFFAFLIVFALIFVAGTHPPTGFIYGFLYNNLPGFAIFRTPFYKFGYVLFFGMIFLLTFTISSIIELAISKITQRLKFFVGFCLTAGVVFSWLWYYQVLLTPDVLYWQKTSTTRVKIPEYIYDFKNWLATYDNNDRRVLLLPLLDDGWRVDAYKWGYWSLSSLPAMLTSTNTVVNTGKDLSERAWLQELYRAIEEGREADSMALASRLGITDFLVRKDVLTNTSLFKLKSPEMYLARLDSFGRIKKVHTSGEWVLYRIDEYNKEVYSMATLVEVPMDNLILYRAFAKDKGIFLQNSKKTLHFPSGVLSSSVTTHKCESCIIETVETRSVLPNVQVLPNSPLYIIKRIREKHNLASSASDEELVDAYLGSVLRRGGEVKRMLDVATKEKYLLENLILMNDYLVTVNQLIGSVSSPENFVDAKKMVDILDPVENNFRIEVDKAKTGTYGDRVISGMMDVLWQIHRIKNFYSPVLADKEQWIYKKLYKVEHLPPKGLFLSMHSLPLSPDGTRIYPSSVSFSSTTGVNAQLTPTLLEDREVVQLKPVEPISGVGILSVTFADLPNKFLSQGSTVVEAPRGPIGCVYGHIQRFDRTRNYIIKINTSVTRQALKLFIKEGKHNTALTYFLRGDQEIAIDPLSPQTPFKYIYHPSQEFDYSTVYVCNETPESPEVSLDVKEVFSPVVARVEQDAEEPSILPNVSYTKRNSTLYEVTVEGDSSPFVLVLTQQFDPLWTVKDADSGKELSKEKHFVVDGYANGWLIDQGGHKFLIEYKPQRYFYLGVAITGVSLVFFLGFIFIRGLRKAWKNN